MRINYMSKSIVKKIKALMSRIKPLKSTCKGNACKNGEDCTICFSVVVKPEKNKLTLNKYMSSNPKNIRLEKCQHVFHRKCLQNWIYSDERKNGTRENNSSNEGQKYINGRKCPNCRAKLSKMDFDKLLFTKEERDNFLTTGYKEKKWGNVKEALAYIIEDPLVKKKQDPFKMDPNKKEFKAFKIAFKKHQEQYKIIQDAKDSMRKIYRWRSNSYAGPKSQGYQIYNYLIRESSKSLRFIQKYKYMPGMNTL
jgi:hypothetical protein